jgi:hypothetical protein
MHQHLRHGNGTKQSKQTECQEGVFLIKIETVEEWHEILYVGS